MGENKIDKSGVDSYLSQLFLELKERDKNSTLKVDIFVMGGSAVMMNNNFRDSTCDIDAYVRTTISLKGSIRAVAEKNGLPRDWLNTNITVTQSFSRSLLKYCTLYRSYNSELNVYIINNLAQICMKLVSFREMSTDLGDIRGIVKKEKGLTYDVVMETIEDIYGDDSVISVDAQLFIYELLNKKADAIMGIADKLLERQMN